MSFIAASISNHRPNNLCLVCFSENKFLKFIFLIFPCLVTIRKASQRKVNSGQKKKVTLIRGKCFPFDKERKTLSFLYIFSDHCLSLSLFENNWSISLSLFENNWSKNNWSISLEISGIFFLYYFLYVFIFSFRSVRIMA
jgi:hypothetical protein